MTRTRTVSERPLARSIRALTGAAALAALASGCYIDTQQFPGLLRPTVRPLPEGELRTFARGPEEAFVTRQSDTVSVRIAESPSTVKLRWYDKTLRAPAGSWVFTSASGMAEVLLPSGSVITMRGQGAGVIGSASRRDPAFYFMDLSEATVTFVEPGEVSLPGGALLESGEGKYSLELVSQSVVRVANRSGSVGRVSYRDSVWSLQPAKSVDLAILDVGTAPFEVDPASRQVFVDGGRLELRGEVDVETNPNGARLRAGSGAEITGYGLVLRLDPGDQVLFQGLGSVEERRAAAEAAAEADL